MSGQITDVQQQHLLEGIARLLKLDWIVRLRVEEQHISALASLTTPFDNKTTAKLDDAEQQETLDGIAHMLQLGWSARVSADQNTHEIDLLMTPPTKTN